MLYKHGREKFYQFLWRPRAASLLSKDAEAEIVRNLKKYSKRFEELDESIKNQQDSHLAAEKQALTDAWEKYVEAGPTVYSHHHIYYATRLVLLRFKAVHHQ